MELNTAKVRPVGEESSKETIHKLCTQFALLIDEVGHRLSAFNSSNQKLSKEIEALSSRIAELEKQATATET